MTHEDIVKLTAQAWELTKAKNDPDFAGVNSSYRDALTANTAALADGRPGGGNMAAMNDALPEIIEAARANAVKTEAQAKADLAAGEAQAKAQVAAAAQAEAKQAAAAAKEAAATSVKE